MLDMKFVRTEPDIVRENIRKKFQDEKLPLVDEVLEMDKQYREAKTRGDYLRSQRNSISKQIGGLMGKGLKEEAEKAQQAAKALFVGGGDLENVPSTALTAGDLTEGSIGILDLMVKCKLAPSKKEARRLVEQGGVTVNDEKVADVNAAFTQEQLTQSLMVRKGKKVYHKVSLA